MKWVFSDPENVAVFTTRGIVEGTDWIAHVSHDEDDGAWQFHQSGDVSKDDARVVGLATIVEIDPSVAALADLPLGWCAWRKTKESGWQRAKNE